RQLHLRVLDVATAREAIAQFHLRLTVATAAARSNDQREAAAQLALVQTKLTQSQAKGGLCSKDVEEMQELTASALTALRCQPRVGAAPARLRRSTYTVEPGTCLVEHASLIIDALNDSV